MGILKAMRYCRICNLYRPPTRTVHCYTCDNCVFGFDHHCIWLGTCIGGGNYTRFLTFLTILVTWNGFMAGSCVHHISTFKSIQAIVILSYTCCLGSLVLYLYAYHLRLLFFNQTTHESLKNSNFHQRVTLSNVFLRLR